MREKRGTWEVARWISGTLAVLLGLYVGAYYRAVETAWMFGFSTKPLPLYNPPYFGIPPDKVPSFFTPIHWLDRRIRPHVWEREYASIKTIPGLQ